MRRSGVFLSKFSLLVAVLLASGCAKNRSSDSKDSAYLSTNNLAEAQHISKQSRVECVNPSECHGAIAMLAIASHDGASVCTGFLSAPDRIVTNSHCVPKDLRVAGASAAGRIWAFFPKINLAPAEQVEASYIIMSSNPRFANDPDHAVIKLSRPLDRPTIRLSRAGVPAGGASKILRVDPDKSTGAWVGFLGRENCDAIHETLIAPFFDNPASPVTTVTSCSLIPGNSGSPLLNSNGEAWGVAFATISKTSKELASLAPYRLTTSVAPVNLVTNFACVSNDGSQAMPATCHIEYEHYKDLQGNWSELLRRASLRDQARDVSATVNQAMKAKMLFGRYANVEWQAEVLAVSNDAVWAKPIPRCVNESRAISVVFNQPRMKIISGLNAYFQFGYQAAQDAIEAIGVERTVEPCVR